jgi:hypothetical protein
MTNTNVTNLSTYLSTPVSGGASTSASAMVRQLTPVSYNLTNDPSNTPPRLGLVTENASSLASTQNKFNSLLNLDPLGIRVDSLLTLLLQAFKESSTRVAIPLIVQTDSNGSLTINLTSFGFTVPPTVSLTPVEISNNAVISSVTATSLTIKSYRSQNILILGGNPSILTQATVHVLLVSNG